jgi:conjugative transposon TraM protein
MEQLKNDLTIVPTGEEVSSTGDGQTQQLTQKFLRKRKFFVVLPFLMLPFMTLIFWALGGGTIEKTNAAVQEKGFNMSLPDAYLKDEKSLDKMSYYDKATLDSDRLKEVMKNDPYYNGPTIVENGSESYNADTSFHKYKSNISKNGLITSPYNSSEYNDANEKRVYNKLDQLNDALNNSSIPGSRTNETSPYNLKTNPSVNTADVDRLEQMMQAANQSGDGDPQMRQLNGMLEKILDIQHPGRVTENIKKTSEEKKGQVFAVIAKDQNDFISLLKNSSFKKMEKDTGHLNIPPNSFYSLNNSTAPNETQNAIEAVIHETQTLVNGSTVKLRLLNDVYVDGILIPKDNFLFGTAFLNGERLNIKIASIRFQHSLFPVDLSVYDIDGMDGIYIPGAITRDVAKQSADRAVQGIGMASVDPSLGAQAASAGIEAARTLISKKVKLTKVTVKAGYRILLKDQKQNLID